MPATDPRGCVRPGNKRGAVSPGCPGIPNTIRIRFRALLAGREGCPAAMFMLGGPAAAGGGDAWAWPGAARARLPSGFARGLTPGPRFGANRLLAPGPREG